MANANAWNNDTVDYLQQCEEEIRVLFEQDGYEIDMLNVLENMLVNLPVASKAARAPTLASSNMLENPSMVPRAWGATRRAPKCTPVASAMVLLGPGVKAPTTANTRNERKSADMSAGAVGLEK